MKKVIFTTLAVSIAITASSQSILTFTNVEKLSDDVNSGAEEIMPMISDDKGDFYFVRANHEENEGGAKTGHDIWKADYNSGAPKTSSNKVDKLNNLGNNAVVGINSKNDNIYLLNAYRKETKMDRGIATSKKDGKWSTPEFVHIDNMDYSSEFLGFYVNPEETVMLISMEGPTTKGKEDLYISTKNGSTWTSPIQLGDNINTSGFEMSPFLSRDGKRLYFSSNGHGGAGSADVFYSEKIGDSWTNWSDPINIESINSSAFDAYFVEAPDSSAYFASNRDTEHSDIYKLSLVWEEVIVAEIEPEVTEENVEEVLEEANPPLPDPHVGNVFFDNNRYFIRNDAKPNLDHLVKVMKELPNLIVTLEGHADKTHHDWTNKVLSDNRAKEAKKYLTERGIESNRITAKGFGESALDVKCDDCTDNQHQLNRRVEFKLSYK